MSESEKPDGKAKQRPRRILVRLTRNIVIYYRKRDGGYYIFPSGRTLNYEMPEATDDAIKVAQEPVGNSDNMMVGLYVVGCVAYQSVDSSDYHHTRFLYGIQQPIDMAIYTSGYSLYPIHPAGSYKTILLPDPQTGFRAD